MAKEILKNDAEEYDAKQPPVSKESSLKNQAAEWRSKIEAIDDEKLLDYISSCCSAKGQQMRAEERLDEKKKEPMDLVGMDD